MYYLEEAALNLTRYRAYDSVSARWLNRDPIAEDGGINLYGYVEGNPIEFVDPLGLSPGRYTKWCGKCSITYDNDQWKGPHTHWQCPSQPQGCIKKNGLLCDSSDPPPKNVKECLKDWGRIPNGALFSLSSCETTCQTLIFGGFVTLGTCFGGPIGGAIGGLIGITAQ